MDATRNRGANVLRPAWYKRGAACCGLVVHSLPARGCAQNRALRLRASGKLPACWLLENAAGK